MQTNHKTFGPLFLVFGFFAGGALAILNHYHFSHEIAYFWIALYGAMFLLALPRATSLLHLGLVTLIPSYVASVLFSWQSNRNIPYSAFFLILITAYAINTFHIVYQENRFRMPYQTLFHAVWDTFIKLSVGCFFTLISWLLLLLWGSLFNLLGIKFFTLLFMKTWFTIWSSTLFFSIGLYIATKTEAIVRNIRITILLVFKYLFPLLAFIGIIFLGSWATMLITQPDHVTISSDTILLLSLFGIIFVNAVYQDGSCEKHYPRPIQYLCNVFLILAPVFTTFVLYQTLHEISQHGLYVSIFSTLITSALLFAYTVCYAVLVLLREKPWLKSIEKVNIVLAILMICATFIAYYPHQIALKPNPPASVQKNLS